MSFVTEHRVSRGRFGMVAAALALLLFALATTAVRAQAAETILWNNYSAEPESIGFANIDGSAGGALNLTGDPIDSPEGMAYDSVTNRLFVANENEADGQITAINLDGSGAHPFTAPGAPIEEPEGVTIDPLTRTIYWINTDSDTISWAKLDGSVGGTLNTTGANVVGGFRLALDPAAGRVYWGTDEAPAGIYFANVNNTGGGPVNTSGATTGLSASGIAVDPAAGRVYWANSSDGRVSFANLNNTGGGDLNTTGAIFDEPYGLALDPTLGKLYWGNYGHKDGERAGALGFALLAGGGGGIEIATAPLDGPQDPVILKSPTGTGAPIVTKGPKVRSQLTCSQGSWGADYSGSFVYQAPRAYGYQWSNNGIAIPGATAPTLVATTPGSYTCAVTASNQAGNTAQTSLATTVNPSKLKLTVKKRANVKAGGVATFKVQALNQGDLEASRAKICSKLSKKVKKGLKAPKCAKFGKANAAGKRIAMLKVKTRKSAKGTYKLTLKLKGTAGKAAKVKVVVKQPKPKKKNK